MWRPCFRPRLTAAVWLVAALACGCRGNGIPASEAARAIQDSPAFAFRAGSPVGRRLIEVIAVRRIGRGAIEVEFTWRDTNLQAGHPVVAPRTSMALLRRMGDGTWAVASLYKVD